jgi:hypothetical protein
MPEQYKLSFERLECSEIRLANNETIKVSGVANIELSIKSQGTHFIDVYILPVTSHPLIKVITKLPNSEQSYKGKVKTHNYINRQNQSTTGKL